MSSLYVAVATDLDFDLFNFISCSLANYNENIGRRGKYLFLGGCAHFHITSSRTSALYSYKSIIPRKKEKKSLLILHVALWYRDALICRWSVRHCHAHSYNVSSRFMACDFFLSLYIKSIFFPASRCKFISKFSFTPYFFQ